MRCVLCGSIHSAPAAHYIPRSKGGLGVEENIVTLCSDCHRRYDNSTERQFIKMELKEYLKSHYPNWNEENLIYKKGQNEKD